MKKDSQDEVKIQNDNKDALIKKLNDRISNLENEIVLLKNENSFLKQKFVSSLKNTINEKASPFSLSLHKGKNETTLPQSIYVTSKKRFNRLNRTQLNNSTNLSTDNNEKIEIIKIGNNHNAIYSRKKKDLTLSQIVHPESAETDSKINSSYIFTESGSINSNAFKIGLKKQTRPNSSQREFLIKESNGAKSIKNIRMDSTQYQKTRNTEFNTNQTSFVSSLSNVYHKHSAGAIDGKRSNNSREKHNQLIQIKRKVFSKSPLYKKHN